MQTQKVYLKAESIYRFLTTEHEKLDTLIMCQADTKLVTTDQSLYEALGSIDDKTRINMNKLVKLLEVTEVKSFSESMKAERKILTEDRVNEVKEKADKITEG